MNEHGFIDLRSDTVTRPTPAMRKAMAEAVVGDDNYGDDSTVNKLQEKAATLIGKEAALFVPTGTMGNQIAIRLHTEPGEEVITEDSAQPHLQLRDGGHGGGLRNARPTDKGRGRNP